MSDAALAPWRATVRVGDALNAVEWTGMARDGAHASSIAVGLTRTAWRIRTGEDPTGEVEADPRPADYRIPRSAILTLWHGDLLRRATRQDGLPRAVPRDSTLERISEATLRLAAADLDPNADGELEAMLTSIESSRGPQGQVVLERHATNLSLRGGKGISHTSDSDAITNAIAAVSLASGQKILHTWQIGIPSSATLRAAFRDDLARTRDADAKTVASFLRRLGLRTQAEAVLAIA